MHTTTPSDVAFDVLFIHGSCNTEGAADAFADLMRLVKASLQECPAPEVLDALRHATVVFSEVHP